MSNIIAQSIVSISALATGVVLGTLLKQEKQNHTTESLQLKSPNWVETVSSDTLLQTINNLCEQKIYKTMTYETFSKLFPNNELVELQAAPEYFRHYEDNTHSFYWVIVRREIGIAPEGGSAPWRTWILFTAFDHKDEALQDWILTVEP